ncbi:glutathione S-transferase family protein [Beijerinckia mobilis]|uniref:glutathione S-transferase family protein n=1 Tax=Beijerinckia mobilis TaxID=231434 RepID=UPI000551EE2B|nr:glutathione S-transferase family protein [Beijerinckia mobilis]
MGLLVDGVWRDQWYDTKTHGGRFERDAARFRNFVTADGAPGPTGSGGFKAEAGRYHLYAAYFCPWAHRTLIFRELKGLQNLVDVSITNWLMRENGITFAAGDGVIADPLFNARYLYEIYRAAKPDYTGRVTVPVLWDKEKRTIVSNESSEIIRMFNEAFDRLGAAEGDYYPEPLRPEIDTLNRRIYETVNNGVYRAGFATSQEAYEEAVVPLFETLDFLEERLSRQRYLCGNVITEADIRLLTTLLRFDIVYVGHFKCNIRRIADYPVLFAYVRDLYQTGSIAGTFRPDHIKNHYYQSHLQINPTGIVPVGPQIDFAAPHGRG